MNNWTQGGAGDFVYNLSLDFFTQLEDQIEGAGIRRKEVAQKLGVTPSAVSQMLNNPPAKPELETLVKYALGLGRKVAIVLYDDDDPTNERGPVYSGIFGKSWEALNKPRDIEAINEVIVPVATNASLFFQRGWNVGTTTYFVDANIAGQMSVEGDWYKDAVRSPVEYSKGYRTPVHEGKVA